MNASVKLIAAVQGGTTSEIQALFRAFAASLEPAIRLRGLIEEDGPENERAQLRSLSDGRRYRIFGAAEPKATDCGCGLDEDSIVSACEAVCRDIAEGCDLLVLNKFAKLEAERTGLADAFAAGVAGQIPILTSVAPKFDEAWSNFAAPLFVKLPPNLPAIQAWWRATGSARASLAASTGEATSPTR
jgi:hypothetical protein